MPTISRSPFGDYKYDFKYDFKYIVHFFPFIHISSTVLVYDNDNYYNTNLKVVSFQER